MVTKAMVVAMADTEVIATCGECGLELDEVPSLPVEERAPCPQCGGYARLFKAHLQAEVKLRSHLALSAKPAGGGKPFLKGKFGLEFFRKTRAWHHVGRTIDRRGEASDARRKFDPRAGALATLTWRVRLTRHITSTDATASADSSTNTPQQHDGWICVPDTVQTTTKPFGGRFQTPVLHEQVGVPGAVLRSSRVEPSMSVNRNVTVPVGSSAIVSERVGDGFLESQLRHCPGSRRDVGRVLVAGNRPHGERPLDLLGLDGGPEHCGPLRVASVGCRPREHPEPVDRVRPVADLVSEREELSRTSLALGGLAVLERALSEVSELPRFPPGPADSPRHLEAPLG